MSLMQLLAVGRSIGPIKDRPSPYKMTEQNFLPRFGEDVSATDRKRVLPESPASKREEPREPRAPGGTVRRPTNRRWMGRAVALRGGGPVQEELRLGVLQVVRNDLMEADLEVVAAAGGVEPAGAGAGWWKRLLRRLRGR